MPRWAVLLLCSLLAGCRAPSTVIRLNTGQGEPVVHVPRGDVGLAEMGDKEFKKAVAKHVLAVPTPEQPLVFARQVFGVPERSGWYRYERKSRRLLPLDEASEVRLEVSPADAELNRPRIACTCWWEAPCWTAMGSMPWPWLSPAAQCWEK